MYCTTLAIVQDLSGLVVSKGVNMDSVLEEYSRDSLKLIKFLAPHH